MVDKLTPQQRRRCMQHNRAKGTRIENMMAKALWSRGLHYIRNDRKVIGKPDFTFRSEKVAVFCDGEFWHGRYWEQNKQRIHHNQEFWYAKIERNQRRDQAVNQQLEAAGWKVIRFWESDIRANPAACALRVATLLGGQDRIKLCRIYQFDTKFEDLDFAAETSIEYGKE